MLKQNIYTIREIRPADNNAVERIIRSCLIEFGGDHEGTAWSDPNLGSFSEVYNTPDSRYWVAEDGSGKLVGGVGIGSLGLPGICELQKMYCLPEARGTGVAGRLIETALQFAKLHYESVYLETLESMKAAQRFYEKHGFRRLEHSISNTGHFACDVCYIKEL